MRDALLCACIIAVVTVAGGASPGSSKCDDNLVEFEQKMRQAGLSEPARAAFTANYRQLVTGAATLIHEADVRAVPAVSAIGDLKVSPDPKLLSQTVMVKLNGGLGTSMGLKQAKSLLRVKGEDTFLDFIAKQVIHARQDAAAAGLAFSFMNSFSTSDDTKAYLSKYESRIAGVQNLEFVQNKSPKVNAETLRPVRWNSNPELEWAPPGHGDLYAALLGSGTLQRLMQEGKQYMFVSNADNLGASMDLELLTHFADSGSPFMMEVATRTEADKKGGHLVMKATQDVLRLRESAQCASNDESTCQDITKHRYFNTNNLWLRLDALEATMRRHNGTMPLPLIKNEKTVDPRDKRSTPVFQLETAMGAAIESFHDARVILVPRTRFAPVKKCNDLMLLRSDAYVVTPDFRLELAPSRHGIPPMVQLDSTLYKFVDDLDVLTQHGVPSLVHCTKLTVTGKVVFAAGVSFKGVVSVVNKFEGQRVLPSGSYENQQIVL